MKTQKKASMVDLLQSAVLAVLAKDEFDENNPKERKVQQDLPALELEAADPDAEEYLTRNKAKLIAALGDNT